VDDIRGRFPVGHGFEILAQHGRRLEAAVRFEVQLVEAVAGAGDMAGDRVERLVLAAITIRRARIDQQRR
jgi:hypothetical protein